MASHQVLFTNYLSRKALVKTSVSLYLHIKLFLVTLPLMKVVATAETLGFISIVLLKVIEFLIQSNAYILTIYILESTSYSLRSSDFDVPTFNNINYEKHSLRYQGPYIWSKLDSVSKASSNIESFKKNIRITDLTSLLNNSNSCCNLCNS